MPPQGFVTEICLFLVNDCLQKLSLTLGGCFLDFGKTTSTDYQNCIFICPEEHLQEDVFPEKNEQFDKFSDIDWVFLGNSGEKNGFSAEKNQHSCQNWNLRFQRDIMGKNFFPERKSSRKRFCTLSGVLFSVIEFVWHVCQKRVLFRRWRFWEKSFFSNKKFFKGFFSGPTRKIVVLWQWNSSRLSKMSFISLGEFSGEFRFRWHHKQVDRLSQNSRGIFLQWFGGKSCVWQKSISTTARTGFYDSKVLYQGKLSFWDEWMTWNFFSNFWRIFCFADSCKKHQKIVKLLLLSV